MNIVRRQQYKCELNKNGQLFYLLKKRLAPASTVVVTMKIKVCNDRSKHHNRSRIHKHGRRTRDLQSQHSIPNLYACSHNYVTRIHVCVNKNVLLKHQNFYIARQNIVRIVVICKPFILYVRYRKLQTSINIIRQHGLIH